MASAAKVLIPLGLLLGVGGGVAIAIWKTKKASASPLEEKPQTTPPTGAVTESQLADEYARAMDPATQDLDYLAKSAQFLSEHGKTEWSGNVRSKIASIQATKGAAQAAAQQQVEAQAAPTAAEVEAAQATWEKSAPRPSQDDVDKMYAWAMQQDTTDTGMVEMAYSTIIMYDASSERPQRLTLLGNKLAKLKAGTYGVATPTESPVQAATEPAIVVQTPEGKETAVPTPSPEAVKAAPEPQPGTALPPLPPEPSPAPPAQQPKDTGDVPPLAKEETSEAADPNGTIGVARAMIDVESQPGWKSALQPLIANWQKKVHLTSDGEFGPKSALKMGEEVGVLPLVRYWPKGSPTQTAAVRSYQTQLYALADKLEAEGKKEHAIAIRASAEHETGQSWPKNPKPVLSPDGQPSRVEMIDKMLTQIAAAGAA